MSRRFTFALAAAALVASAPASAWEPTIVGFDDDTVSISDSTPVLAASQQSAARVTPEMVSEAAEVYGARDSAVAAAPATRSPIASAAADPGAARVTPEMVSEATEAAGSAPGSALASAPASAPAIAQAVAPDGGAGQVACVCPGQ